MDELKDLFLRDQIDADVALTEEFVKLIDELNAAAAAVGAPPMFFLSPDRKTARMHPDLFRLLKQNPHPLP